jgi:hypothetical protein
VEEEGGGGRRKGGRGKKRKGWKGRDETGKGRGNKRRFSSTLYALSYKHAITTTLTSQRLVLFVAC